MSAWPRLALVILPCVVAAGAPRVARASCSLPRNSATSLQFYNRHDPRGVGGGFKILLELRWYEAGRTASPLRLRNLAGTRGVWLESMRVDEVGLPEGASPLSPTEKSEACAFGRDAVLDLGPVNHPAEDPSLLLPGTLGRSDLSSLCCSWEIRGFTTQPEASLELGLDGIASVSEAEKFTWGDQRRSVYSAYGCNAASGSPGWGWILLFALPALVLGRRRAKRPASMAPVLLLLVFLGPGTARGEGERPEATPGPAVQAPRPTLVFTGVRAGTGEVAEAKGAIEKAVEAELSALDVYQVASQAQMVATLDLEQQKQLLGCSEEDQQCMADLVGVLGSQRHLYGSLDRLGALWLLTLTLVDTAAQRQIASRQIRASESAGVAGVIDGLPEMIRALVRTDPLAPVRLGEDRGSIQIEEGAKSRNTGEVGTGLGGLESRDPGGVVSVDLAHKPLGNNGTRPSWRDTRGRFVGYAGLGFLYDYASLRSTFAPPAPGLVVGAYAGAFGGSLSLTYVTTRSRGARAFDPATDPNDPHGALGFTPVVLHLSGRLRSGARGGWVALGFGPSLAYPYLGVQGSLFLTFVVKGLEFEYRLIGVEGYPRGWLLYRDEFLRDRWKGLVFDTAITTGLTVRFGVPLGQRDEG